MSKVISLENYKRRSRKAYLAKYGPRLDRFIERFVGSNLELDFRQLADDYVAGRCDQLQEAWDYVHFREVLAEALDEVFGKVLYQELRTQHWFDPTMITQDEIVDRCLSTYIIDRCRYAVT